MQARGATRRTVMFAVLLHNRGLMVVRMVSRGRRRLAGAALAGTVIALATTVACGSATSSDDRRSVEIPAVAASPARPRVVALGDSLTSGLGLPRREAFPSVLQRLIDEAGYECQVVNAGSAGETTAGGLRRLEWALDGDVRILIVALGANDGLRGLSIEQMRENLSAMIEEAQSRGIEVLLAGMEAMPNFGPEYTQEFRDVYPELAERYQTALLPFLLDGVAGDASLNQADRIHPNAEGARRVADLVWSELQPMLDVVASE